MWWSVIHGCDRGLVREIKRSSETATTKVKPTRKFYIRHSSWIWSTYKQSHPYRTVEMVICQKYIKIILNSIPALIIECHECDIYPAGSFVVLEKNSKFARNWKMILVLAVTSAINGRGSLSWEDYSSKSWRKLHSRFCFHLKLHWMNLIERYDQLNFELMVVVASIAGSNWTLTWWW